MYCGMVLIIAFGIIAVISFFAADVSMILISIAMIFIGIFLTYDLPRLINRPDITINQLAGGTKEPPFPPKWEFKNTWNAIGSTKGDWCAIALTVLVVASLIAILLGICWLLVNHTFATIMGVIVLSVCFLFASFVFCLLGCSINHY